MERKAVCADVNRRCEFERVTVTSAPYDETESYETGNLVGSDRIPEIKYKKTGRIVKRVMRCERCKYCGLEKNVETEIIAGKVVFD